MQERIIITGLAGSGKSVYLKSLFTQSIENGHTYYPIFFELRSLPQEGMKSLKEEIFQSVKAFAPNFTKKQFEFGLKYGHFYLIIDALDETPLSLKDTVSSEINDLARKYLKCPLVLTSRPSEDFVSWEGFSIARLQPFTLEKCVEYIDKIDFDEGKKREFLDVLKEGLLNAIWNSYQIHCWQL